MVIVSQESIRKKLLKWLKETKYRDLFDIKNLNETFVKTTSGVSSKSSGNRLCSARMIIFQNEIRLEMLHFFTQKSTEDHYVNLSLSNLIESSSERQNYSLGGTQH